jgi:hypothetical protein
MPIYLGPFPLIPVTLLDPPGSWVELCRDHGWSQFNTPSAVSGIYIVTNSEDTPETSDVGLNMFSRVCHSLLTVSLMSKLASDASAFKSFGLSFLHTAHCQGQ